MSEIDNALDGALWAARRGFAVHPLDHPDLPRCAGVKMPGHDPATCTERGKHPTTKFSQTATADTEQVVAWFAGATRNYGIATGPSGVFVVDDDAVDNLIKYAASIGEEIPSTLLVATSRGFHYYFAQVDPPIGCSSGALPKGIDVKGAGGYVVGPGSRHASGRSYVIVNDTEPAAPPAWLLAAIRGNAAPAPTPAGTDHPFATLNEHAGPIGAGERHTKLLAYAGHLRSRGLTAEEAKKLMSFRLLDCEQPAGNRFTQDAADALVDDVFARYDGPPALEDRFHRDVLSEAHRLRVLEAARTLIRNENEPPAPPMDACLLDDIDDEEAEYRVDHLIPWEGNALIVAKRKTGKTTWLHNLTASLRTGDPFLGGLQVPTPITGRIGFLNYELPRGQFRRWAHDVGLTSADLYTVHLRNRRNPLGHEGDLEQLTQLLLEHDVKVLMVDPLSRAFVGDNINDTTQMTRFLASLDQLKGAIGAHHLILAAHAGWNGDRARNSSVIEDWADSIITLTKNNDGERFMSAIGRDVELEEDRLDFDYARRRLTLTGHGNRAAHATQARITELADALAGIVAAEPGLAVTELEDRLRALGHGLQKGDGSRAASHAAGLGYITREKRGRRMEHFPNNMPQHAPKYPDGAHDIPRPALSRAGYVGGISETTYPEHDNAIETAQLLLGGEVVA